MRKVQLSLPKNYFHELRRRVLEYIKENEEALLSDSDINEKTIKIKRSSPSIPQIIAILKHFFNDKKIDYITNLVIEDTSLSRALSQRSDGRGAGIELLDQIVIFTENSFETSFLEHFKVTSTEDLERFVCDAHKKRFGGLNDLFSLYDEPEKLPQRIKEKLELIKVNHKNITEVNIIPQLEHEVRFICDNGKEDVLYYYDGKFFQEKNGKKIELTSSQAILFICKYTPSSIKATTVSIVKKFSFGVFFSSTKIATSISGYTGIMLIVLGLLTSYSYFNKKSSFSFVKSMNQPDRFYDLRADSTPNKFISYIDKCLPLKYQNIQLDERAKSNLRIEKTLDGTLQIYFPPGFSFDKLTCNKIYLYKDNGEHLYFDNPNLSHTTFITALPPAINGMDTVYYIDSIIYFGRCFLSSPYLNASIAAYNEIQDASRIKNKVLSKSIVFNDPDVVSISQSENDTSVKAMFKNTSYNNRFNIIKKDLISNAVNRFSIDTTEQLEKKIQAIIHTKTYKISLNIKNFILCRDTKYLIILPLCHPMFDPCLYLEIPFTIK